MQQRLWKHKCLNFDETLPENSHLMTQHSQIYQPAVVLASRIRETGCVVNEDDERTWQGRRTRCGLTRLVSAESCPQFVSCTFPSTHPGRGLIDWPPFRYRLSGCFNRTSDWEVRKFSGDMMGTSLSSCGFGFSHPALNSPWHNRLQPNYDSDCKMWQVVTRCFIFVLHKFVFPSELRFEHA